MIPPRGRRGYATTIRRAQGASLSMGCIYLDQKYRVAGRGYGYVATSRFRTRGGCYLYGHMRRTDFLPVGGEAEDEVLETGYDSLSDDDDEGRGMEYAHDGSNVFDGTVDICELVANGIATDYE